MKRSVNLAILSGLSCVTVASAFNTGDQFAYTGSFYIGGQSLSYANRLVDSKLFGSSGLSAAVAYLDVEIDEDARREYNGDFDQVVAALLYVHKFEEFSAGLALSFSDSELTADSTSANPGNLKTDADGWLITAFVGKEWERWSLSAKASMGKLSVDSIREDVFSVKTSGYDSEFLSFELITLYSLISNEEWNLTPFAKVGYSTFESDAFSEVGLNPNRLDIAQIEDDVPYAEIGLRSTLLTLGSFVPYAAVSIWRDLGDDSIELVTQNGLVRADVPDAAETIIRGELGFDYSFSENFSVGAFVDFFSAEEMDGFGAALSGSWRF